VIRIWSNNLTQAECTRIAAARFRANLGVGTREPNGNDKEFMRKNTNHPYIATAKVKKEKKRAKQC
jgi:hypothetical protein